MNHKPLQVDDLFQAYMRERLPSEATIHGYKRLFSVFFKDTNITEVHAVTKSVVLTWRDLILTRARVTTWNTYLRQMRALFSFGEQTGLIDHNVFKLVRSLPVSKQRRKSVDYAVIGQAVTLLGSSDKSLLPGWFWVIVIRFIFTTGMRRTQLVALRWSDVNLEARKIRLRAESSKTKREWFIPITVDVAVDLERLKQEVVLTAGQQYLSHGQVFNVTLFYSRYKGDTMTQDQVSGFFRRLSNRLGPDDYISSHRLRHAMATALAPTGDIATLQAMLGHTDVRTTLSYVEPDLKAMTKLLGRLPQL